MSRDPSGIYSYPDGTRGSPGTTIFSARYNTFLDDLAVTLNTKLPVNMGGTNANSADAALKNLSAEKATQLVIDYNTHVWFPGSFRSDAAAPGAPNATSSFAGIAYINEPLENPPTNQNVVVEARDMDSAVKPGLLYTRQKTDGVWSAWNAAGTGDDQTAARSAIYAAPFDAMAYNGMQINGNMDVSQENGINEVTVNAAYKYIVDGFFLQSFGPVLSGLQNPFGASGHANSLLMRVITPGPATPAAGEFSRFVTVIEGQRIARLGCGFGSAQPFTIAFWVYSQNRSGVMGCAVRNGDGTRSYPFSVTINAAATWEYKVITIPPITTGSWSVGNGAGMDLSFCFSNGSSSVGAANTWHNANYLAPPGCTNFTTTTIDSVAITGLVILPGAQAPTAAQSSLIMRPYDQELVMCQRYYVKLFDAFSDVEGSIVSAKVSHRMAFPCHMRTIPTAVRTDYSPGAGTLDIGVTSISTASAEVILTPSNSANLASGAAIFAFDARL